MASRIELGLRRRCQVSCPAASQNPCVRFRATGQLSRRGSRRRRQSSDAVDADDPELDVDDVMFKSGDGEAAEEDEELLAEEEGDMAPEAPEFGGDDLEGWDAALANFDSAQDALETAAAEAQPSKEEQERAKALAMSATSATLEVSELAPEEEHRPKTFDEQTVQLSVADKAALASNRQGYAVFPMDGAELLVSETPDGRFNLADCFTLDIKSELFSRPTVEEEVPSEPLMYQLLPWEHTKTGDSLKNIDPQVTPLTDFHVTPAAIAATVPTTAATLVVTAADFPAYQLMRMYFVGVSSTAPYEVDMSRVFSFDSSSLTMQRHDVITLGDADSITEPVLRIREDGVFVEDAINVPGIVSVAEGFAGHPEQFYMYPDKEFDIREYVSMGLWPEPGLSADGGAAAAAASLGGGTGGVSAAESSSDVLQQGGIGEARGAGADGGAG
eukprot:gene4865-5110_t